MTKYLYGAAVQGIQGFIFQTNALQEIAGASELVEQICTDQFKEAIGNFKEENAIVTAAGNIKYIFDNKTDCENFVRSFPKMVMEFAPGITISQAVVEADEIGKDQIDELERKLRAQRNKPFRPYDVGLMAVNRSRKTGIPAVKYIKQDDEYIDLGVDLKRAAIKSEEKGNPKYGRLIEAFFGNTKTNIALDMKDITNSKTGNYSWLAVIHADGNNMGVALQKLANETKEKKGAEFISVFRSFSNAIDQSTKEAARKAYLEVMKSNSTNPNNKLPFRPIVIGGDDLTVICRADLAIEFTRVFLQFFEEESEKNFNNLPVKIDFLQNGLTACAGIAFIKESYPFHYGYHLAETLCGEAKKAAKEGLTNEQLTPSCLMFHKVQDSFVEDYKEIKARELKSGDIQFDFGPYYLKSETKPTIDKLQSKVEQLEGKEGNAIKSHLRQWLTDLHNNKDLAEQKKLRLISMGNQAILKALNLNDKNASGWMTMRSVKEKDEVKNVNFSPIYDWLTINSINQGGKEQ